MARKLIVEVVGDTSRLERGFRRGSEEAGRFGRSLGQLRIGLGQLAKATVAIEAIDLALRALHETIHAGIEEVSERAKVNAQLEAALKSTGNQAHVTTEELDAMATAEMNLAGVDDELIKSGEAVLLTFTNIRNYAGKNNQIFDEATRVMVDFATKTGKEMPAAALAIGRALQDPAKAAGALRRAQVVLTASEKEAIATAVEHGDTLKAQKLILEALDVRYGGQAKALGETLPGQINRLRESLRNLAGDLGTKLEGPLERVVKAAGRMAKDPSWANLGGVFEAIAREWGRALSNLARWLGGRLHALADAIRGTDFHQAGADVGRSFVRGIVSVFRSIRPLLSGVADVGRAIGERLAAINWPQAISGAARRLGRAIAGLLNYISDALERVDWNQVGQAIITGLGAAIGAVLLFLGNLDWNRIGRAIARLVVAAVRAAGNLLLGAGRAIATLLGRGLRAGLDALGRFVQRKALEIMLKIVEPFTHLPGFLGGGLFRGLKERFQDSLDLLKAQGEKGGQAAAAAVAEGLASAGPERTMGAGGRFPSRRDRERGRGRALPPPPAAGAGLTAAQRQALSEKQQQARLDRLMFAVDQAEATKTLADDLRALRTVARYLRQRIAATKDNLDLRRQLLTVEKQITEALQQQAEARAEARAAAQFRLLGLGPGGEELVPGIKALQRQLDAARKAIAGTFLDTRKQRSLFGNIKEILSGQLGAVGAEVRQKIAEILRDIREQLKDHTGELTRWRHASTTALIQGLGLSPEQAEALRGRLATLGPGRTVPPGTSAAFSAAGATGGVTISGGVHVYGVTDVAGFEREMTKRQGARAHPRRGAR